MRYVLRKPRQVWDLGREKPAFDIHQTGIGDAIKIRAEPLAVWLVFDEEECLVGGWISGRERDDVAITPLPQNRAYLSPSTRLKPSTYPKRRTGAVNESGSQTIEV
jgi:hypothetical protein